MSPIKHEDLAIINNTVELLGTMDEGLFFIKGSCNEPKTEVTLNLILDFTNAFASIEKAVTLILSPSEHNYIQSKTTFFRLGLDKLVKDFETTKGQRALEIIEASLEPSFNSWKEELERLLKPYITA